MTKDNATSSGDGVDATADGGAGGDGAAEDGEGEDSNCPLGKAFLHLPSSICL
jgi:hypothetical protein